jgi:hypothetical protein
MASDDLCEYFKYCGGASPKKSVNSSTAASINPSNIARIKGLGFESLLQSNNPPGFTFVTGNGRVGGALISPTLENSFFGVRSLEIDDLFLERFLVNKRYLNKKINLALGIKVVEKRSYGIDIGLSLKRNPDIQKLNPGFGFSTKLGFLNFGAYVFKDDVKLDFLQYVNPYTGVAYQTTYNSPTYQETYLVKTFTVGTKVKNYSLDVGYIQTKYKFYDDETKIMIYSAAINYGNFLFNLAHRVEHSPNLLIELNMLKIQKDKSYNYLGVQYMAMKNLMLGLGYNTFLMDEISATVTIFLN